MPNRTRRHSEINVVDVNGVVHTGTGDGLAQAARDLGETHDRLTAELQGIARTPGTTFEDAADVCAALSANEREATRWTAHRRRRLVLGRGSHHGLPG